MPIQGYLIFRVAAPSRFFEGAEGLASEWFAQGDDLRTLLRDFVTSLPKMMFPVLRSSY
jgi:hypothetical protein